MFKAERLDAILEEVALEGRVTTTALAKRFGVSEDSIRKDLQGLGAQGKLQRVYGGAVSIDTEQPSRTVTSRLDCHRTQKLEIAQKAYDLIEDGQTIFLDISSTNLFLADLLAQGDKRVIVISNMLDVVKKVAAGRNIEAQCPGGKVNLELSGFVGASTARMLGKLRFDISFLGTLEMNIEEDCASTFDMEDGTIKQTVLENSRRSYLVADSHKFNKRGEYRYARLSDFTGIITDGEDAAHRQAAAALDIEVI
ncbi:DeoR/GlpR family DNA-binding transcription regulator [Olsenella massiliensis]|uniref:DeoR/GlpR family DNA-binding transcription regulator n=1 Tax=Olsenella massiliensis TaxID=1622075 RepID=UPI00071E3738|nr:DeoR/GlpR family DNA-binding transcription regulator [Olsenella massiliensis]